MPEILVDQAARERVNHTQTQIFIPNDIVQVAKAGYSTHLRQAFNFMRAQGGGHYSDTALMRVARASDRHEAVLRSITRNQPHQVEMVNEGRDRLLRPREVRGEAVVPLQRGQNPQELYGLPSLAIVELEARYDEMTETKYGGLLGICVAWPTEGGRTMIAVQRKYRRLGIGKRLFQELLDYHMNMKAWVHRDNSEGQAFLSAIGLAPSAFNSQNAICYSQGYPEDGDEGVF